VTLAIFSLRNILVLRGRAPFGQHQESRPLAGPDFLSMGRVFVSYSQPIRFDRSLNRGLPVLDKPRGRDSLC